MDLSKLRGEFILKRKTMSLRQIEKELGISASTLNRFENGGERLDSDNVLILSVFCGLPLSEGTVIHEVKDTLQEIENVIFSDKHLTPAAKTGLTELMIAAYRGLTRYQEEQTCQ